MLFKGNLIDIEDSSFVLIGHHIISDRMVPISQKEVIIPVDQAIMSYSRDLIANLRSFKVKFCKWLKFGILKAYPVGYFGAVIVI